MIVRLSVVPSVSCRSGLVWSCWRWRSLVPPMHLRVLISVVVVCILSGPLLAEPPVPVFFVPPTMGTVLPAVPLGEIENPRLWAILFNLSSQEGIRPAGDSAYVTPGSTSLVVIPLLTPTSAQLTLFFDRSSGQYLFLLRDRTALGEPEAHFWSTGEEELAVTSTGLRILSTRSAATFRLRDNVSPQVNPKPNPLDQLKCYLEAAGIDVFSFTSFKAFFSRPGLCSAFNTVSLVETAISCVTSLIPPNLGDAFNCAVGISVILSCEQCPSSGPLEPYGVDSNTAALYHFEDSAGNVIADATGVNPGVATGTTIVSTLFGHGRQFRGSGEGDYITVPDNTSLRGMPQMTIEAWVYPTGFDLGIFNANEAIVGRGDETSPYDLYELTMTRNPDPASSFSYFTVGMELIDEASGLGSQAESSIQHAPNNWYYIVGTYDGQVARVYVNGVLEQVGNLSPGIVVNTTAPLYLDNHTFFGQTASSNGRIGGTFDEVRISNVARSASEIAAIYAAAPHTGPH